MTRRLTGRAEERVGAGSRGDLRQLLGCCLRLGGAPRSGMCLRKQLEPGYTFRRNVTDETKNPQCAVSGLSGRMSIERDGPLTEDGEGMVPRISNQCCGLVAATLAPTQLGQALECTRPLGGGSSQHRRRLGPEVAGARGPASRR
jgi:hypothetical protein